MMKDTILLWLVRHGTTTDSNKGIIRGNRDSMLDRQGFLDAHELKEFFGGKRWQQCFCSDMTRAIQTATIICEPRDEAPVIIPALEPWDVGYLTGKDKKTFKNDMTVFVEHPNMRPQEGETRNEFFSRVNPIFLAAMKVGMNQDKPCIVVGHSSVLHALAHLLWGEAHPPLSVDPGGVIECFLTNKGEISARSVFKKGADDSSLATGMPPTS